MVKYIIGLTLTGLLAAGTMAAMHLQIHQYNARALAMLAQIEANR